MSAADLPVTGEPATADAPAAMIFVGGCERSGTTVVGRILAEQLSLVAVPEAYFHAVAYRKFGPKVAAGHALRHWRRRSWGTDPERGDDETLTDALAAEFQRLYEQQRGVTDPARVVETTPDNIEIGSLLLTEFPEAHLVHVVRDPRSVAASLKGLDFGPRTAQEVARLWKQRIASGLALEMQYPERVHRIRYEDLIMVPGEIGSLRDVVSQDGVPAFVMERDVMIDHTSQEVQRRTDQELDMRRIWSWRKGLSDREIAAVEFECRELMNLFGYAPEGVPDGRGSMRRRFDTIRSAVGEVTFGTARRALRAARSVVRSR